METIGLFAKVPYYTNDICIRGVRQKGATPRVLNRLRETMVLEQVFRFQILDTNQVVVFDQDRAEFLGEILALVRDLLVDFSNLLFRFQVVFHSFGVKLPSVRDESRFSRLLVGVLREREEVVEHKSGASERFSRCKFSKSPHIAF